MRIVMRADAAAGQGAGHVMRCLAIAEVARDRGHDVTFVSAIGPIYWLRRRLRDSGFPVVDCDADSLDAASLTSMEPDWVVVDSYAIPSGSITALNQSVLCLALIDGDHRGADAALYVDPNLDSENRDWPEAVRRRLLAGARYAIIRQEVLAERRTTPWKFRSSRPQIVAFMGGTDPFGAILRVAEGLVGQISDADVVLVTAEPLLEDAQLIIQRNAGFRAIAATESLPRVLANADIVISAAGTSAWDLCALGLPSVLVAVVDNQVDGLRAAVTHGVVAGFDAHRNLDVIDTALAPMLQELLRDELLRRSMSERARAIFDGYGATRVLEAMEAQYGVSSRVSML